MKSYVELTKSIILNEVNNSRNDKSLLFRVEDAPRPEVYWEVASFFERWARDRGKQFVAKLSYGKYEQFLQDADSDARKALDRMKAAGYIDERDRMTYWRNQAIEPGRLTILMGTEAVEDKGGLGDFYAVTAYRLDEELRKRPGKYADWFELAVGQLTGKGKDAINNVVEGIFRATTRNLFLLSTVVDVLAARADILDSSQIIEHMFDRLYRDWGLPRIATNVPSISDLARPSTARSLFENLSRFSNRQAFRNMNPKRVESLIESIRAWNDEVDLSVQAPDYSSLDQLKQDLISFVTGRDLPRVRPRILSCDYMLLQSMLQLPSSRASRTRKTTPKVYGPPIKAFLSMLIDTLAENRTASSISISVDDIRLAGCSTDEERDEHWYRLRLVSGGLLEFLNAELGETCALELRWDGGNDPFTVDGLDVEQSVGRAAATKKLSRIEFTVAADNGKKTAYVWEFDPRAPWLYTFFDVRRVLDAALERHGNTFIPIGRVRRFSDLTTSNNEEEFFSRLETAVLDYTTNVVDLLKQALPGADHAELLVKVERLGKHFTQFLTELDKHGLYARTTQEQANALVDYYCNLIDWLGASRLTSAARAVLVTLANAFLIIDEHHEPFERGLSGAVVLPTHPAMLEKLMAQAQFMRDGAREVVLALRGSNGEANEIAKYAERWVRTLEQLSTISLAVDAVWSNKGGQYIPPTHTFGYFAIYRGTEEQAAPTALTSVLADDIAADEEIPAQEVLRESAISEVIFDKLKSYLRTFPSQGDGLHIVFVNPPDLQPVVAGIHRLINTLKNENNGTKVRVRLTVLAPPQSLGSRSYLHYWLDNFFEDADDVDISTYFKTASFSGGNIGDQLRRALQHSPTADVIFIQNLLGVTEIQFEKVASVGSTGTPVTRFPMVFYPLPVFRASLSRRTSISQRQFAASSAHARLVYYLSGPMNQYVDCGVVNRLQMQKNHSDLLAAAHEHSRWVVCIDPGVDREIISNDAHRIISFATGVGPFGELNVTVSSRSESAADVQKKLQQRLKAMFHRWTPEMIASAARRCIDFAERLDGAQLLRALNPDDHQLHSFLAYVLTVQYLNVGAFDDPDTWVQTLIPLDSYEHWFKPGVRLGKIGSDVDGTKRGPATRPDYLLLEVKRGAGDQQLRIRASVIECKMGNRSQNRIEQGEAQLSEGIRSLQEIWNPQRESIDRRYWYSQLYRALVFSPVNMAENDPMYWEFNKQLQEILDGKFSIEWRGLLLTYWLDSSSGEVATRELRLEGCDDVPGEHHTIGQFLIEKMLVAEPSEISYAPGEHSKLIADVEDSSDDGSQRAGAERAAEYDISTLSGDAQGDKDAGSATLQGLTSETPELAEPGQPREASTSLSTAPKSDTPRDLRSIRLLIGEDVPTREPVYWEFGHPELQNRHILITGSSGTGKTYFMQALLLELSRYGVSSLIFDYTDGFTPQKLEPEFLKHVGDKLVQLPIYHQPFPLNPFKRYPIEVAGSVVLQKPVDVAERIKSSFIKVFGLGDQQANAVYNAVKQGLEKYGENMTLADFGNELRALGDSLPPARTALARLEPLIDRDPFDHTSSQDWGMLERNPGSIVVVQLSGFTRDVQVAITQLILWDAWYYQVRYGDKNKPFPVVLDEAQNLDHSETAPTAMILTEGRKFGWSGWFATQFLKGQMEKDELGRLQQASQKIFFRPPESELREVALMIDPDKTEATEWQVRLARLKKGQCVVSGWTERNGHLHKDKPRIVNVAPLSARGGMAQ